jgi:thiol-disulfide isomerase/thioredoxin
MADPDLDAFDRLSARELRAVLRGGTVAVAILAVTLLWSLFAAPRPPARIEVAPLGTSPQARQITVEAAAAAPSPAPAAARRMAEVTPARRLQGLFGLQLGFLRSNDIVGTIAFNEVIRGTPAVKLINLWATWCAPCVREIAMFRELSGGWRRDIRFVPIHVGPVNDGAAYRRLVDQMPVAAAEPLIDASGDALQGLLREAGLLEVGEGIPITLLLDCRNELRWIHVGDLPDTAALSERLTALRGELGSPRCAPPEPPPTSGQPSPPGCGDGVCTSPTESCANCAADCACIAGTECRTITGDPVPRCVFPDEAFDKP